MSMTLYGVNSKDGVPFEIEFPSGKQLQEWLAENSKTNAVTIDRLVDNNSKPYVNDPDMLYQGGNEED